MKKKYIVMVVGIVGGLMLLGTFIQPIWRISLEAPQYPDGISMYIWINQITGETEYTLQNVNILNHYIGMQSIEPDSIAELVIFPYIIILMTVCGIVFSFFNNYKLYILWIAIMALLGIAGMVDFYLWLYDYGHNLNPNAAIKVPGMTYQPPLIGSKMLLNFKAISLPHWGSAFLAIGVLFQVIAAFLSFRTRKNSKLLAVNKKKSIQIENSGQWSVVGS